jgi:hypothetical protein
MVFEGLTIRIVTGKLTLMKIRFVKTSLVDLYDARLKETYDKHFQRWDELLVEELNYRPDKKTAHVVTYEGNVLLDVPSDAFEVVGPKGLEPLTNRL